MSSFSKGFALYIDNDYLSSYDVNFEKWDSDKNGGTNHTRFEFDGNNFVGMKWDDNNDEWVVDSQVTKKPTTAQVLDYLASAYYQITGTTDNDNKITLSSNYVGLGSADYRYAFRGVIVGKSAVDGQKVKIENASISPFIKVSNGCVVKNVEIKVTAPTIELTNNNISNNAKFDYSSNCPYYGAVIGEIMGGDSIIDDVQASFIGNGSGTAIKIISGNTDSNNAYKYAQIVPVGGYVGVVVYGGLIFRNMSTQSATTLGTLSVTSYNSNKTTVISSNCMSDTNMAHLYVNPIVGRVVNAHAVNETASSYNYTNATSTLKNSTKNYAIPDINSGTTAGQITFTQTDSANDTISIPDGQSLFLLSCITQSMAGNASTSSGNYNTRYSYGENYKTVHHAKYTSVGTDSSTKPRITIMQEV